MSQIAFKWPKHVSYASEDLIVSDSNAKALAFIDSGAYKNEKGALIYGPPACGKTHIAHYFSAKTGAIFIDKTQLGNVPSEQLWQGNIPAIIDDIEIINNEPALFNLLRHAEIQRLFLLFTSKVAGKQLPFSLPDLRSRLISNPLFAIEPPDENLLRIYITKCFSDRQLPVSEEVIGYITKRIERSFIAVHGIVEEIER